MNDTKIDDLQLEFEVMFHMVQVLATETDNYLTAMKDEGQTELAFYKHLRPLADDAINAIGFFELLRRALFEHPELAHTIPTLRTKIEQLHAVVADMSREEYEMHCKGIVQ